MGRSAGASGSSEEELHEQLQEFVDRFEEDVVTVPREEDPHAGCGLGALHPRHLHGRLCGCGGTFRRHRSTGSTTSSTGTRSRSRTDSACGSFEIDTPEVYFGVECYGRAASRTTEALLPVGSRVRLFVEPATDRVDQYGRLLRYVVRVNRALNVNVRLVAVGAAAPYFYRGRRGRYAGLLETLAKRARTKNSELWKACPHTPYDPYRGVQTRRFETGMGSGQLHRRDVGCSAGVGGGRVGAHDKTAASR